MPHVVDLNTLVPGIAAMPPPAQLTSLQAALAPIMLRTERNASQRAHLPPQELWLPCALPPVQRGCIKTLLARFYDVLTDAKLPRYSGHKAGQFRTICGELRKMCSHPLLVPEVFDQDDVANGLPDYLAASGKLQLLDRLLRLLKGQGKRVAVAAQSPKMMDVLEAYLRLAFGASSYVRVDSTTPAADRYAAMQTFNRPDSDAFVFLLAPRACGLGTQLPTIDVVVAVESDWNARFDFKVRGVVSVTYPAHA